MIIFRIFFISFLNTLNLFTTILIITLLSLNFSLLILKINKLLFPIIYANNVFKFNLSNNYLKILNNKRIILFNKFLILNVVNLNIILFFPNKLIIFLIYILLKISLSILLLKNYLIIAIKLLSLSFIPEKFLLMVFVTLMILILLFNI